MTNRALVAVLIYAFCVSPLPLSADDTPTAASNGNVKQVNPEGETIIKVPAGSKVIIVPREATIEKEEARASEADHDHSLTNLGLWYDGFSGTEDGSAFNTRGLLSVMLGKSWSWDLHPVSLDLQAQFYTPQIFWKAIGLGLYYFFCYFFTAGQAAGSCGHPDFGTGPRDAGSLDLALLLGYQIPSTPLHIHAGPDLGFYYSGSTPRPFTALMAKGGVAVDVTKSFGFDLSVARSLTMNEWSLEGLPLRVTNANLVYYTLSAYFR